ncbi:hypothetical protein ACJD0Z_05535 [Flavobacteriaceae bacterium M23B6Z8]
MAGKKYIKIKPHRLSEEKLREIWYETYCKAGILISTFDTMTVRFYEDDFDHCFYESANRRARDKSILSLNRLEKIFWIKDAIEDTDAVLKSGWLRDEKRYDNERRVALVKGNYVVIIRIINQQRARFVTAYEITDENGIEKVLGSPDWQSPF